MDHIEIDVRRSIHKLTVAEEVLSSQKSFGLSPALESFCVKEGINPEITEESLGSIIENIKSKIQQWVDAFKSKIQKMMGKGSEEDDIDPNMDYEMPISEETGKKYTALKVAGIALAVLATAWLVKGGTEIAKGKLEVHRYKKELKAGNRERAANYSEYIKGGEPYKTLQSKGSISGWLAGKSKMQAAQRDFNIQLQDLKRLQERDKLRLKQRVNEFKAEQRQHNGYLWAGHKVANFSSGKDGFVRELLRVLGQFVAGIGRSFASKSPNDSGMSMTRFMGQAIKAFFQVFGQTLWSFLKNLASLLAGRRPVSQRYR